MFCTYCGAKLEEGQRFCAYCGHSAAQTSPLPDSDHPPSDISESTDEAYRTNPSDNLDSAPSADIQPSQNENRSKKLLGSFDRRVGKYAVIALVALVIVSALIFFSMTAKQKKYERAVDALSEHLYGNAAELFNGLGNYKDSKELYNYSVNCQQYFQAEEYFADSEYDLALNYYQSLGDFADAAEKSEICRNNLDYMHAVDLLDSREYMPALELFSALGDFENSAELAEYCEEAISYEKAVALFDSGSYAEASQLFSALTNEFDRLPEYIDVCGKMDDITLMLQDMEQGNYHKYTSIPQIDAEMLSANTELQEQYLRWSKYYDALTKYNSGARYQAMLIFDELGDMADAAALSASCPQDGPKTGELYHNNSYSKKGLSLKVVMPKDGSKNVIKIYTQGGTLVSIAYAAPGESVTIKLPAGIYMVKNGYSTGPWYGTEDMFGPSGTYKIMTFDNNEYFELENGYQYTMTLRTTKTGGDPVGEMYDEWNTF